ncbi:BUD13-like protein [Frankliniella fusca]|uniref:BUD13 homolog n=1 Tax=Frankliniella fusca TaxID=407009 RepID=A0AAE1LKR1_9NEOP|nr:BUD13-like protein [Frankliniella fusca]
MSTETGKLSQKDYLKKYLSKSSDGKKKKKKKVKGPDLSRATVKLIDDDVDLSKLEQLDESALDLYELNEDAPQIVGIVDERPEEVKALDQYKQTQRWKVIGDDGGDVQVSASGGSKTTDNVSVPSDEEVYEIRPKGSVPKSSKSRSNEDSSPPRRRRNDSDESPPRKGKGYDSDVSPPRKKRQNDSDTSPPRKRKGNDSDTSPPRKRKGTDTSQPRQRRQDDSDASPPRMKQDLKDKSRRKQLDDSMTRKKSGYDSDASPPRKSRQASPTRRRRKNSDSDTSPPRRRKGESREEAERDSRQDGKMKKTLDGKRAGLQDAKNVKQELMELKRREDKAFEEMDVSLSGRGAVAVQRDRKTGMKRDLAREAEEERVKNEAANKHKEKYSRWGKGLKQTEDQHDRLANDMYEMSKPLARYADDKDLDSYLREQDREGDPMLEYLRNKKKEESKTKLPLYQGAFPPNRYNIRPGYRWDGVDRSNGYEKKRFDAINAKKAVEEEAYKWSTADM